MAEYHIEKMELCERIENQLESIRALTEANERYNRMFGRLGVDGCEQGSHTVTNIQALEDKISDLIAESSENILELNEVRKENMKLHVGLEQLKKTLQLTNRELDRTDKEYRNVAKQLQEIQ